MKLAAKIFSLLFVASLSIDAAAQTTTTSPRERPVLQIFRYEGADPVYQEVPGSQWSPLFRRVEAAKPVRLPAPVRAVRVASRLEEQGGARVFVSLLTGERFHDEEVPVTSFAAREGEEIFVRELERYGVEPFRVVAEVAMHHFRKQLLDELSVFEQRIARSTANRTPPRQTFPQWLQSKLDAYEKWLARL